MPSPFNPNSAPITSSPFVPQKSDTGLLGKIGDVLATPREAVVGAVRAFGAGEDIIQGAQAGVAEKLSFGDLLKEHGATPAGAAIGGFALDLVADPLNYVPLGAAFGLLKQGAKSMGKIAFAIDEIPTFAGEAAKFNLLSDVSGKVEEAVRTATEKATLRSLYRRVAKTDIFPEAAPQLLSKLKGTVGKEARATVRQEIFADRVRRGLLSDNEYTAKAAEAVLRKAEEAGSKATLSLDDVVALRKSVETALDKGMKQWSTEQNVSVMNDVRRFTSKWLRNVEESLRRDKAFGTVGAPMARLFGMSSELADQFKASSITYFEGLMRGMKTEARLAADKIARGEELGALARYADDPKVKQLAEAWSKMRADIYDTGRQLNLYEVNPLTGEEFPIRSHSLYAPEYRDPVAVRKWVETPSAARDAMVEQIKQASGKQMTNEEDIQKALWGLLTHDHVNWERDIRAPGLQFARLNSPVGFERDPAKWIPRYLRQAGNRLAFAKFFGGRDNVYLTFRDTLKKQGGDVKRLDEIWNLALGRPNHEYSKVTDLMRKTVVASMLDLGTTAVQATQFIPIVSTVGFKNAIKGALAATFDAPTRALIRRSGALLPSATGEFTADSASFWVKLIQLQRADRAMRGFAGAAGAFHAQDIAERYVQLAERGVTSGRDFDKLTRALHYMKLDPADILRTGGAVSEGQMRTAMQAVANSTQLASEFLDLPEKAATPAGRWAFMLRKFGLQQARWMDRHVMAEFQKGNYAPLARLMIAAPVWGGMVSYAIDTVRFRQRDVNLQSIITDALNGDITAKEAADFAGMSSVIGLLGIWGDIIMNAPSTPDKFAALIGGPGVSLLGEGVGAAKSVIIDHDVNRALKTVTRRIPGVGRAIVNYANQ